MVGRTAVTPRDDRRKTAGGRVGYRPVAACMHARLPSGCHEGDGGGEREFVNKRQFTYQRGIPHLHPDRTKRTWPWPDMALLRRQRAPRRALLRTATSQRVAMGRQSQVPSHCLCGGGSCLCTLVSRLPAWFQLSPSAEGGGWRRASANSVASVMGHEKLTCRNKRGRPDWTAVTPLDPGKVHAPEQQALFGQANMKISSALPTKLFFFTFFEQNKRK
jgi:hypothetical protein